MRQPPFAGERMLRMDEKGRILLPPEIRRSFDPGQCDGGFYTAARENRTLWIYPDRTFEQMAAEPEDGSRI